MFSSFYRHRILKHPRKKFLAEGDKAIRRLDCNNPSPGLSSAAVKATRAPSKHPFSASLPLSFYGARKGAVGTLRHALQPKRGSWIHFPRLVSVAPSHLS